jgi:hypothetical protein
MSEAKDVAEPTISQFLVHEDIDLNCTLMILLQGLPHASSLVAGLAAGILAAPSLLRRHSGRIVSAPAAAVSPLRRDCGGAATLGGLGPGPLPVPARRPGPRQPQCRS